MQVILPILIHWVITGVVTDTENGALAQHSAEATWRTDETHHYHLCIYWTESDTCQETLDYAEHADGDINGKCDTCELSIRLKAMRSRFRSALLFYRLEALNKSFSDNFVEFYWNF